jgi:SAM-dependent methyltransferase
VLAVLDRTPPGRALDLGCGTGTNAIALAQRGWDVTAIDFSSTALNRARRKARQSHALVRFLQRDVTRLDDLAGPFDFALDLGCFHGLAASSRAGYVANLARLLRPGAVLMMYAFLDPAQGWPAEAEIRKLHGDGFDLANLDYGEFRGRPSGWFTWIRRS